MLATVLVALGVDGGAGDCDIDVGVDDEDDALKAMVEESSHHPRSVRIMVSISEVVCASRTQ
jgi:hypothetical protein